MMDLGTTGYLCLLPFDFHDPFYQQIDNMVVDYGMGLCSDYLFECALNIMLDMITIDDVINYLDDVVFPEHVPNDSLASCLELCIVFISYAMSKLLGYKSGLNLLVSKLDGVSINEHSSTLSVKFDTIN